MNIKKILSLALCMVLITACATPAGFSAKAYTDENNASVIVYNSSFEEVPAVTEHCNNGDTVKLLDGLDISSVKSGNYKLVGWSSQKNGEIEYKPGAEIKADKPCTELYAVWAKISLAPDEIIRFGNSRYNFCINNENRYIMSRDDCRMLQRNLYRTYGPGPVPNPILSIVLSTYPNWEWQGSCYGISAVTALQHLGYLNVLPMQNAECMRDMRNTEEFISCINYYQANAATSYLTENKAPCSGSMQYARSLEYMFDSVKQGNIVIFTFYENAAFVSPGHTVLLTGAYTDYDGSHVILAYDCNKPYEYSYGRYETKFIVSSDYKTVSYEGATLGAINWTDNFEQFRAFDIEGNTDTPAWYRAYFLTIRHSTEMILEPVKAAVSF